MSGNTQSWNRRSLMKAGIAGVAAFGPGIQLFGGTANAAAKVVIQYDWLMSNGQIGDVVAVTNGQLDFGPWEQIFYGEFDGKRRKRVLVKIIGE